MVPYARGLTLAYVFLFLPFSAQAQLKTAALARIRQLNKMAMVEYDSLEFDKAKQRLFEALKLSDSAGVDDNDLLSATHLNLGVVYGAGFGLRDKAVLQFLAALKLRRTALIAPGRATPGLEAMFKEARAQLGPPPPEVPALQHQVVDEARTNRAIPVTAKVKASLGAARVLLFYRGSETAGFTRVQMLPARDGFRGVIPAAHARGRSIYYYVEAQDAGGGRLAGKGEAASPMIISLIAGPSGDSLPTTIPAGSTPGRVPVGSGGTVVSLSLFAGTGVGLLKGGTNEHSQPIAGKPDGAFVGVKPGTGWSGVHVGAELAWHVSDAWHVSVLGRFQLYNGVSGGNSREEKSYLGLLRVRRFFSRMAYGRFYLSTGAGAGQIRHLFLLQDYDKSPATPDDVLDTRIAGVAVFSAGGGFLLELGEHFGLIFDITGMVLAPDFAAHADFNMGLVFSL